MDDRKQQLFAVVEVLTSFVRSVHVRRTLETVWANPHLNFWRVIYGNLTDVTVLEWCKLFGSDDEQNQPVHWKNVVSDHEAFLKNLLATLGIEESRWLSYWDEMKKYRDQAVAHHDERRRQILRFPQFDLALRSAAFYYDFVRSELLMLGIDQRPEDLSAYGKDFATQCRDVATAAIDATRSFRENVH